MYGKLDATMLAMFAESYMRRRAVNAAVMFFRSRDSSRGIAAAAESALSIHLEDKQMIRWCRIHPHPFVCTLCSSCIHNQCLLVCKLRTNCSCNCIEDASYLDLL